jgi:hypothetical protein
LDEIVAGSLLDVAFARALLPAFTSGDAFCLPGGVIPAEGPPPARPSKRPRMTFYISSWLVTQFLARDATRPHKLDWSRHKHILVDAAWVVSVCCQSQQYACVQTRSRFHPCAPFVAPQRHTGLGTVGDGGVGVGGSCSCRAPAWQPLPPSLSARNAHQRRPSRTLFSRACNRGGCRCVATAMVSQVVPVTKTTWDMEFSIHGGRAKPQPPY